MDATELARRTAPVRARLAQITETLDRLRHDRTELAQRLREQFLAEKWALLAERDEISRTGRCIRYEPEHDPDTDDDFDGRVRAVQRKGRR